jgi:hypothetical protein
MKIFNSIALLLLFISNSHAFELSHIPEIGLGSTNNVNLEESDKDKDTYVALGNTSTLGLKSFSTSLNLNYKKYNNQSDNDSFGWDISFITVGKDEKEPESYWSFGLGGQHYLGQDPASSDEAFDYSTGSISYTTKTKVSADNSYSFTTGYDLTKYAATANRRDHKFSFNSAYEYILGKSSSLTPLFGVAYLKSTESDYSKASFDLGVEWLWLFTDNYEFSSYASYGRSIYIKRTFSSVTTIIKNRKAFSLTDNTLEKHTSIYLSLSLTKSFELFDLKGNIYRNKNKTNSGYEDYAEFGFGLLALFYF